MGMDAHFNFLGMELVAAHTSKQSPGALVLQAADDHQAPIHVWELSFHRLPFVLVGIGLLIMAVTVGLGCPAEEVLHHIAIFELVVHRIAMVGARLVQELVEVVVSRRTLVLALGRRDLASGGRSAVLLILLVLAARRRPVVVTLLFFCRVLVALEDGPDRLLAGGVVGGNLQELIRSVRLLAPQFVDQGLAVRPAGERADDVGVEDARL